MKLQILGRPPRALRKARLDNVALVPASLLPYRDQYQAIANGLPAGGALIVLPSTDGPQKRVLETAATVLQSHGHRVTIMTHDRFG
jgi:hypothetical protein